MIFGGFISPAKIRAPCFFIARRRRLVMLIDAGCTASSSSSLNDRRVFSSLHFGASGVRRRADNVAYQHRMGFIQFMRNWATLFGG